ncbi:MAG: hypothetical protein JO352_09455, partial [Chloroflexi bacterium]|nr:hypothetical protein [Chloroflexota bacterium]
MAAPFEASGRARTRRAAARAVSNTLRTIAREGRRRFSGLALLLLAAELTTAPVSTVTIASAEPALTVVAIARLLVATILTLGW